MVPTQLIARARAGGGYTRRMHTVINTLRFKAPLDPSLFSARQAELASLMRPLDGFRSFQVVQVADDQVVLVVVGDDEAALNRMASAVGNTWMAEHVAPLLAAPPERRLGLVIASVGS